MALADTAGASHAAGGGGVGAQPLVFDHVAPATRLLEKRRQMYEVQDALEQQKAKYAEKEEHFRKKEEQLRAKDLQLQHQLIRFNKFLQDNEAKRRRAETRATEERSQIKQKEEEIAELEDQLETGRKQLQDLEEQVKKNMKYEEFLEQVKIDNDEFAEITDLLTRYDTLDNANQDLLDSQGVLIEKNEDVRSQFQTYKKDTANQILAYNNRIAALQRDIEDLHKRRGHLQHLADEAVQSDSQQSLHVGQILTSVENLFERCVSKRPAIQHANELEGLQLQLNLTGRGDAKGGESAGGAGATSAGSMSGDESSDRAKGSSKKGDEGGESEDDITQRQAKNAIKQLHVIKAYIVDFMHICKELTAARKGTGRPTMLPLAIDEGKQDKVEFLLFKDLHRMHDTGGSQHSYSRVHGRSATESASSIVSPTLSKSILSQQR
ncbi:unnamed protein product [Vitrella brassicaformis CCMP3155]|uniref:DUF4200 domain-containing protein n=2 Tax=Vitrella brassicaformis TaxID=1169539 RepID=A0A0G4H1J8_VITBC|nr:unnamed protein product [Vitrella brassicaformis CCMP3155]|eukprot:CEM37481.1 unnamed protein product [Vitrella brassicaformis CCMP3155]